MTDSNALAWRTNSFCGSSACVEVAKVDAQHLVRDSKNPEVPTLTFTVAEEY